MFIYNLRMDTKKILWENVRSLMIQKYGYEYEFRDIGGKLEFKVIR